MGGPESQEILFRTSNKPAKLILGGSTVHSSGRISKGSDDRDMQFAAEFLKTVEDPTENGNPPHPGIPCSKSILGRHFFLESRFFRNPNGALLADPCYAETISRFPEINIEGIVATQK